MSSRKKQKKPTQLEQKCSQINCDLESLDFVALYQICCFKELPEPFWFSEGSLESLGPDDELASRLCS